MNQYKQWENEYKKPVFLTKDEKPQADTVRFMKFLRQIGLDLSETELVDLGCGTGRNGNYFASLGATVSGIELSKTATLLAQKRAQEAGLDTIYIQGDMGQKLPYRDEQFDIAIDVMSSNSLTEEGRKMFVSELHRILKPGGYVYIKALCKDGDKNAKQLLKKFPGSELDTYIMPETGITERVFSEGDFRDVYGRSFDILSLEKKSNYIKFGNQSYKRNYWLCYMKK